MRSLRLNHWIVVLTNAYMEYTYTPWDDRNVYRRTVDYRHIPWC
ncbi:hypothetical protein [Burkholderia sp. TSV86]|nr:hypothetical protein [Burkholderia sp. TSV86]